MDKNQLGAPLKKNLFNLLILLTITNIFSFIQQISENCYFITTYYIK